MANTLFRICIQLYLLSFYLLISIFILFTFRFLQGDEQLFYLGLFILLFLPIPLFFLLRSNPFDAWLNASRLLGATPLAVVWWCRCFWERFRLLLLGRIYPLESFQTLQTWGRLPVSKLSIFATIFFVFCYLDIIIFLILRIPIRVNSRSIRFNF